MPVTLIRAGTEAQCGNRCTCPLSKRVTHAHQGTQEGLTGDQEIPGCLRPESLAPKAVFQKESGNLPKMAWPAPKCGCPPPLLARVSQHLLLPRPTRSCGQNIHRMSNEVRVAARPTEASMPSPLFQSHSAPGETTSAFPGFSPPSSFNTHAWFTLGPLHLLPPLPLP